MVIGSTLNLIPFLDIPYTNRTKNTFRNKFFELFGIKKLSEILDESAETTFKLSDHQVQKLKRLLEQIKEDKLINKIDDLLENTNGANSSNYFQKVNNLINSILPSAGVALASLSDDILARIPNLVISAGQTLSRAVLLALSLVTIPIGMGIYVMMLKKTIELILIRYEEYALIIAEILHPTLDIEINLVRFI